MTTITLPITTADPACAPRVAASCGPVAVRPVDDPAGHAAWVRYVDQQPAATVFHHPDWSDVVSRTFGHRPLHLLARRAGRVVGVLPLMEVDSWLGGRLHISVPYGTYGGVLADDDAAVAALAAEAARGAEQRGARVLEFRSAARRVADFEPVDGYLSFARDLPERPEDVPGTLPKRARAAARHARDRDGVYVRHDPALIRTVWDLYCRSMRRIGSVNYPLKFFNELVARFGARAWVSVAFIGPRPIAGTLSLAFGHTLMPYILGADERIHCDGAANWLYWSVMEEAVRCGLRRFDYGRSRADNAGAVGFKKNQGFEPEALGYQRYVPPGRRPPDLKPSNPHFALARRLWRRMPLPLTRLAGAWLSHALPG
jgi:FemAB-related protein (PEP-CTERM system-associated)